MRQVLRCEDAQGPEERPGIGRRKRTAPRLLLKRRGPHLPLAFSFLRKTFLRGREPLFLAEKGFPPPRPLLPQKPLITTACRAGSRFFATVAAEAGCRRPGTCPRPKSPSLFVWLACSLTAGTLSPAGAYPRKVTNSERKGLFPVWPVFLPPERPTARQSVCRLSAPSIVFVDIRLAGSSAASSALLSRHQACECLAAPEFASSWPAGAFFPSHITAGIAGKGHASPGLHDPPRPALPLSPVLPPERRRRPQCTGHGLAGWHVKVPKQKNPRRSGDKTGKAAG